MSSTTSQRPAERGQVLVLFAGGLVLICLIAALVFDVGQNLLDRRAEQNSSDSAALAGARYVSGATYVYHGRCSTVPAAVMADPSTMPAIKAACQLAVANGYVDGSNGRIVRVDMPPIAPSVFSGLPGHIEVSIGSTRPSFFQGVIGVAQQQTAAMAVATNDSDIALPYSLLALNPTGCGANKITGSPGTAVTTNGTVHIDSNCSTAPGAVQLAGNGVLTAPECDVVGIIQTSGGATNNCTTAPAGVLVSGDPLRNLPPPAKPAGLPASVAAIDGGPIPAGCPGGSSPATDAVPATCSFSKPSMGGKTYRIFPGYYPGGIEVTRSNVYMEPGIYWIGGSGIQIKSTGSDYGRLISKATGDNTGLLPSGGVLIYNSVDAAACAGGNAAGCYGPIHLNGGDGSTLAIRAIQSGQYKNMVIFVDRTAATGNGDVDLNGGGSTLDIKGTIYAPSGNVKLNGSDSDTIGTQIICYDFVVNGSGSSFTMNYSPGDLFHLKGVGLVE